MSLRTKSRIPASTSDTAPSTSVSGKSSFSGRMTFIVYSPLSRYRAERASPHDERRYEKRLILAASRRSCGIPRSFGRIWHGENVVADHQFRLKPAVMLLVVV